MSTENNVFFIRKKTEHGASLVQVIIVMGVVAAIAATVAQRMADKAKNDQIKRVIRARDAVEFQIKTYLQKPESILASHLDEANKSWDLRPCLKDTPGYPCPPVDVAAAKNLSIRQFFLMSPNRYSHFMVAGVEGSPQRYDEFGIRCDNNYDEKCILDATVYFFPVCSDQGDNYKSCLNAVGGATGKANALELHYRVSLRAADEIKNPLLKNANIAPKTGLVVMPLSAVLKRATLQSQAFQCPSGYKAIGHDAYGNLMCQKFAGKCSWGADFSDKILREIKADGELVCEDRAPDVTCSDSQWVVGIDADNKPICGAMPPQSPLNQCEWTDSTAATQMCPVGKIWVGQARVTCKVPEVGGVCSWFKLQIQCCGF